MTNSFYYSTEATGELPVPFQLIHDDCAAAMQTMPSETVDLVFADPPYFLSNGGTSCSG